jgi:hypothetical protein
VTADVRGGFLVCDACGHRRPVGDLDRLIKEPSPKHCEQTMRVAAPGLPAQHYFGGSEDGQ